MQQKIPSAVKQYAQEDISEVLRRLNSIRPNISAKLESLSYQTSEDGTPDEFSVYPEAIISWIDGNTKMKTTFMWDYVISGDDVYSGGDVDELLDSLEYRRKNLIDTKKVNASTRLKNRRITAADEEDMFDDSFDDEIDPETVLDDADTFTDTIDDLSEQVEDIQDQVEEIDEDDITIEMENNIANHYIAECEHCHGIFISAMIESDQEVERISGVCPLCEKESDQYLKWVVKEVDK